ncbi:hypothetical protein KVR01_009452 [Diaporthe batatas]|uniref:uncharacterized protein n=1 Tax=Diaporthe batatas TaxID=748121 RepID=UPI001D0536DF|nr:uncharacterized protein KVR01_009452 [Diaporthe batatas]KAG8161188.1 hypothetical protein KVR01_009452 [Diaporthe batatas]
MRKYVLAGCDGNLGSVAASHALSLLGPEDELVLTSHRPGWVNDDLMAEANAKGAKLFLLNYDDPVHLVRVFAGAEAVAFISTWEIGKGRRRQHKNVIDAAKAAGVRRIVYTSFVGADLGDGGEDMPFLSRDHAFTEALIRESGLEYNIQRNYLQMDKIPQLYVKSWGFAGDRWLSNDADEKAAFVAKDDCGRVLGALLMGKGEPNTVYTVTGPEAVTNREIFEWMANQSGYKGTFENLSDEALEKWWKAKGLPYDVTGDFSKTPCKVCMLDLLCRGQIVAGGHMKKTTDAVERLTGRKPAGFREYLLRYKDSFPKSE